MQIVIPMSGFGERFRKAGYALPKPLIPVEGKPIIAHVVDMFPGDHDFIFICNRDHLANPDYRMAATLRELKPDCTIVPVDPHKQGPVHAVLKAEAAIDPDKQTIVNYCDFTCYWDFEDFADFVEESDSDGCVPAYRGFHPHSLGSTYYAYIRHQGLWLTDIQEKQPYTDHPMDEFASSGTYYFRSGALCLDTFRAQIAADLTVNGEFYASLAYRLLAQQGKRVSVYQLQHFMQWGTPQDMADYNRWSGIFRRLGSDSARQARHDGAILLPMAGLGQRFADAGYELPKPLVPVSGRPMVIQAMRDLPSAPIQKFVLRKDLAGAQAIERKLRASFVGTQIHMLDKVTEGQAITCLIGAEGLDPAAPVTIGACDNGILYDVGRLSAALERAATTEGEDRGQLLVWIIRGHADAIRRPEMFGWVECDAEGGVTGVRVKKAPADPAKDAMIIGTFSFSRLGDFVKATEALIARNGRVNGEYYVDSLVEDCLAMGVDVRLFEIDAYIGWGTPIDLQTFEYWQSCFHKWASHPYRLEKDGRVPAVALGPLNERYAAHPAPRPEGVSAAPSSHRALARGASPLRAWLGLRRN